MIHSLDTEMLHLETTKKRVFCYKIPVEFIFLRLNTLVQISIIYELFEVRTVEFLELDCVLLNI